MKLKIDPEDTEKKFVTLANKNTHSGFMHGVVSNGGEISLTNNISVAFVKLNDNYLNIQIRVYDEDNAPKKQTFIRTKVVKEKVEVEKKDKAEELLFEDNQEEETW